MRRDETEQSEVGERGFTLVEVLIASFLFAVGMVAAMAMQYTALGGYANARDLTNATDVGERVIQIMKTESQQWRQDNDLASITNGVYKTGTSNYFAQTSLLKSIDANQWTWQPVFSQPVDVRLSDAGARRFCAYVRGGILDDPNLSSGTTGIMQVQVVVVYPSSDRSFPNPSNTAPFGLCNNSNVTGNLNPLSRGDTDPSPLELAGYRGVYMGAQIVQRRFLDSGAKS